MRKYLYLLTIVIGVLIFTCTQPNQASTDHADNPSQSLTDSVNAFLHSLEYGNVNECDSSEVIGFAGCAFEDDFWNCMDVNDIKPKVVNGTMLVPDSKKFEESIYHISISHHCGIKSDNIADEVLINFKLFLYRWHPDIIRYCQGWTETKGKSARIECYCGNNRTAIFYDPEVNAINFEVTDIAILKAAGDMTAFDLVKAGI